MTFYNQDEYTLEEVKTENPGALEIREVTGGWAVFTDACDLEIWESQD